MNIEKKNLDRARELLAELATLEDVEKVCGNYDAKVHAVYSTVHNNNTKRYKEVSIKMPKETVLLMKDYISHRIEEIHKELEAM